jgi:dsDNA-binding SOS-regulon protein
MSQRKMAVRGVLVFLAAAVLAACGGPEKKVVDQYFSALNQGDDQTLASFAAVKFEQKVQKWKIMQAVVEERSPAELATLAKKLSDAEVALADNKKEYNKYFLDHPKEVDQIREALKKNATPPAALKKYADDWKGFTDKERDLKRQLADAKEALEKEKRNVALSLGNAEQLDGLTGDLLTKKIDLTLTVAGETKPYTMTLRKYEMQGSSGKMMSRWVVYSLEPK